MTDAHWYMILAFVYSMNMGLIVTMILWGWTRREWTPPQYGRFGVLALMCANRVYVGIRVAGDEKWRWDFAGVTLSVGFAVFFVMIWSWYYTAIRGGPPCEVFRHLPWAYKFCKKFHSARGRRLNVNHTNDGRPMGQPTHEVQGSTSGTSYVPRHTLRERR